MLLRSRKSSRNMNQWLVQFFVLSIFIVTVPRLRANDDESAMVDTREGKKLTEKDFPYSVASETKKLCTLADMTINITVSYTTKDNSKGSHTLQVPRSLTTEGTCLSTISVMKLSWKEEEADANNTIRFTLINDHASFSVFSIDTNIYLDRKNFKNATDKNRWRNATSAIDLHLFSASTTSEVYKCNDTKKISMDNSEIQIGNVSLIAFNTGTDISSRKERTCNKDETETFPYVLKDKQGSPCALARMKISMNVSYTTKDLKKKIATISVPTIARVVGKCDSTSSVMEIIWTAEPKKETTFAPSKTENSLTLGFVKGSKYSYLNYAIGDIYMDETTFSDAAEQGGRLTVAPRLEDKLFAAPANNGLYSCAKETTLNASNANITVNDILLLAFDAKEELLSKRVSDCTLSEESFKYVVRDPSTMVPCVLANMDINVNVSYEKSDKSQHNVTFVVPRGEVTGNCGNKRSEMKISWPATEDRKTTNSIVFRIASNSTFFFVNEIEANMYMDEEQFPNAIDNSTTKTGITDVGLQLFRASAQNGLYKCLSLTEQLKADDIYISISDVSFVAFNTVENVNSREVETCADEPNTDTTSSTTESSTESSSTTVSSSSATEVSTPEPDPSVKEYHYVVTDSTTHVACIVANMSISIKILYRTKDNKTKEATWEVPTTATTNGKCEDASATMELSWPAGAPKDSPKYENEQNVVTFSFKKSQSAYHVNAVGMTVYLDEKQHPEAAEKKHDFTMDNVNAFSTNLKNFYKCDRGTSMKVKDAGITISKVKLIAFNTEKSVASRSEENCVTEEEDTDVGAIIGGIIGGIIIIGVIVGAITMYRKRRGNM